MKKKIKTFWKNNKELLIILGGIVIVYFVLSLFEIPTCPSKVFLGIPCAGCGLSRAFMSALKFDYTSAFEFNPAWSIVAVAILVLFVLWIFEKMQAVKIVGLISLALLIAIYIYRVVFTESPVVAWNFESGLVYRGYTWIISFFNN